MRGHGRSAAFLIGLSTAAAVALVLLAPGRANRSPPRASTASGDTSGHAHLAPAAEPRAPAVPAPAERGPAPAAAMGAGTGERAEVVLVRADTGAAVTGAVVWTWAEPTAEDDDQGFESALRLGAIESALAGTAPRAADRHGRVALARASGGSLRVVASAPGLWGSASFDGDERGALVVPLVPDVDLVARVVDPSGLPVTGAAVALREEQGPAVLERLIARTDPAGLAVLRHASWVLRSGPTRSSWSVGLRGVMDPAGRRVVDPREPLDELVPLVLPPSGACVIALVDAGGRPLGEPFEARLRLAADGPRTALAMLPQAIAISRAGEAVRFEPIAIGHDLELCVTRAGAAPLLQRGRGPRSAGECVEWSVRASGSAGRWTGRLVDASGAPIADAAFRAWLEAAEREGPPGEPWSLRTGPDGRFSLPAPELSGGQESWTLALHRMTAEGARAGAARCLLAPADFEGDRDLGELVVLEAPLLCAGLVVDERGEPVAGALVSADASSACASGPVPSDASGAFELRGESATTALVLAACKPGLRADPLVVVRGTREVRLKMRATGELAGRVLVDPSLAGGTMFVEAVPEGPGVEAQAPPAARVDGAGAFALRDLAPGAYSIRVVHAPSATPLGGLDGLTVRPGATTRDPRLDPLDLRAAFRSVALELVDETGAPPGVARALSRPCGAAPAPRTGSAPWTGSAPGTSDAPWISSRTTTGRLELLTDGRPLDVAISAPGYLRVELECATGDRRVVLERAARLCFALPADLVPAPPLQLGLQLTPLETGRLGGFDEPEMVFFGADGTVRCPSAFTGEVRIEFALLSREGGKPELAYLAGEAPRIVRVERHVQEQVFVVRYDPARFAAALEETRAD